MNFTIMIPTRKRPILLTNLLQSITSTSQDINNVEIIVTSDLDDVILIPRLEELKRIFPKVIFLQRERHYSINDAYYNWMATKYATGKYLIAVNDDTRFINYGWDTQALTKINKYLENKPDGIFYGITDDREVERKRNDNYWFSCFPLISKAAVDALGFFFDPIFHKDGADWDIYAPYKELGRTLDLRTEIIIEHISFRSGRRKKDDLDYDVMPLPHEPNPPYAGKNMREYVNYLTDYILCLGTDKYKGVTWLTMPKDPEFYIRQKNANL